MMAFWNDWSEKTSTDWKAWSWASVGVENLTSITVTSPRLTPDASIFAFTSSIHGAPPAGLPTTATCAALVPVRQASAKKTRANQFGWPMVECAPSVQATRWGSGTDQVFDRVRQGRV